MNNSRENQTSDPSGLSHLDEDGRARMVDVSAKSATVREAEAEGFVELGPELVERIMSGSMPKGDVLNTARIAGVMGAKRTSELIPLCHPLPLDWVHIEFERNGDRGLRISCVARTTAQTGVEMEALTGVSVSALTIYDMVKAVDKSIRIGSIRLIRKSGGKSGDWQAS